MSHHSSEPMGESFRQMMESEAQRMNLGATGRTPHGSVHESDEGELMMGVSSSIRYGKVYMNFGKPVAWVGMTAEEACGFAALLIEHAKKLGRTETLNDQLHNLKREAKERA